MKQDIQYINSKPFKCLLQQYIIEPQEQGGKNDYLHEDGNISIDYIIRYINNLFMSGLSSLFEDIDEEDNEKYDYLYNKLNNRLNKIRNILFKLDVDGAESIKTN